MADVFQSIMFAISPGVLILDAIAVTSGVLRKFGRLEKEDEAERTRLFTMVDIMEKVGMVLGVITLLLAGYLAVKSPYADEWFNPLTIVFLCIIGALLALRMLEDTPVAALIALLAGFLGAAIFAVAFGTTYSKWIYFAVFLVIDVVIFLLVRLLTTQMAMIGKILNWMPIAIIVSFACLGWAIYQLIMIILYGIGFFL